MPLKKIEVTIKLTTAFYSYGKKTLDARAIKSIERGLRETIAKKRYMPMLVEKDPESGEFIEDATRELKIVKVSATPF